MKYSGMYTYAPMTTSSGQNTRPNTPPNGREKGTSEETKVPQKLAFNPSRKTSLKLSDRTNDKLALAKSIKLVLANNAQFSNKESKYLHGIATKGVDEAKRVD